MKIRWPQLKNDDCAGLSLCGSLVTDSESVLSQLKKLEPKPIIAKCNTPNGPEWVRLDCDLDGKHLHIDAVRKGYFGVFKPTPTHSMGRLQKELSVFLGQMIKVTIVATFAVPYAAIPKRGLIQDEVVEKEKYGIRMTGGRFEFRGMPLVELEWRTINDGREITVDVKVRREAKITENYVIHALKTARAVFDAVVLESFTDGTAETESSEQIAETVS